MRRAAAFAVTALSLVAGCDSDDAHVAAAAPFASDAPQLAPAPKGALGALRDDPVAASSATPPATGHAPRTPRPPSAPRAGGAI